MPTVGKSTLVSQFNRPERIRLLDTDWLHELLTPDGRWHKWWRSAEDPESAMSQNMVSLIAASASRDAIGRGARIVTNLLGNPWAPAYDVKPSISVGVPAERLVQVFEERGTTIDHRLARKWVESWEAARFQNKVMLSPGEFLSDVITLTDSPAMSAPGDEDESIVAQWYNWAADLALERPEAPDRTIIYGATSRWFRTWSGRSRLFKAREGVSFHKAFEGQPGREGVEWTRPATTEERLDYVKRHPRTTLWATCKGRAVAMELAELLPGSVVCSAQMWLTESVG
jgi:hypothetical protein